MNIVFFGSSEFAVPSLKAILGDGHTVSCVVTQPDREKGRGLHLAETAIKQCAKNAGLRIYQPYRINVDEEITILKELRPDLFVVVAYGQILSKELLAIPRLFSVNVHASLLPSYRGAAPINRALIDGETQTGVTVMQLTEEMDAGPIIAQAPCAITLDDTAVTLGEKLSVRGGEILRHTLQSIANTTCTFLPQDTQRATYAPKLSKKDGLIHWHASARAIHNLVRGLLPWPGAFTMYQGTLLKIYKASVVPAAKNAPGLILDVSSNGIVVSTADQGLRIEELQMAGKRKMTAQEFISGYRVKVQEILG